MNTAGRSEEWTGPRLAARLADLNGVAPEPAEHVVFRAARRAEGRETTCWQIANDTGVLNEAQLAEWLARRRLGGPERLALAVLVIRETLDERGLIRDCVLERRRGAVDGPLHGDPARVEFTGPARMVRVYRVLRDGRLSEVAASTDVLPPRRRAPEHFAGEQRALRERFGPAARIIDVRQPTLFEDIAGLDSIAHVRASDGRVVGCGIGWHGTIPFILEADFPRFGAPLSLAPEDEVAVEALLAEHDLVRHETRLDEQGLAVMARRRSGVDLFLLRSEHGTATMRPYLPASEAEPSPDQARWLRYAETYEKLAVLDTWHDDSTEDLLVLTGESSGQVWRHHIDHDGVETWRKPDDDAAAAVLHGERLFPGTLAAADAADFEQEQEPLNAEADDMFPPPADSVLAKAEAYVAALAALHDAGALAAAADPSAGVPLSALQILSDVPAALSMLTADATAGEVRALTTMAEDGRIGPARFSQVLSRIETRLMHDLAAVRVVLLTPGQWRLLGDSPLGRAVEEEFPELAYDLEEAAQCLALRRPTASVFHAMRVVERGLKVVEQLASIDLLGDDRRWTRIMTRLRASGRPELAGVASALADVRRCARGPRLVPEEKYTEAEAERLFQAVGGFVRELAAAQGAGESEPR
ncbi:MAG TPA: hypothetical protein VGG99_11720 [Acetobacteraceae bacterium]|jgi:hypothetical protein